jgi:subtilase family serine protease
VLALFAGTAHAASDFTVTLSAAVSGSTVTYTATACGSGKKEGPLKVGLYYDQSAAPSCATTPSHQWSVVELGAGLCEVLTHVRSNVAVGSYTAWALVDSGCAFVETEEGNNTASWVYKIQPDLSISSLTAAVSGAEVTYTITVKNSGVQSGPFTVGLYYHRATAPTCSTAPDQTLTVSAGLALNQSTTLTYLRTGVPIGSYTAWALADQGCTVGEASETNNTTSKACDLGPNIYVLTPVVTVTATTVVYSVTVCANYSSESLAAFTVGLWYHQATAPACGAGGADHTWSVASLAKGSCTTLSHTRSAAPPGSYTAWVFADPGCTLTESRESDNARGRAYLVGAPTTPDLTASSLTATVTGTTVVYKVTVCNQGAAAAGFSVGLSFHATAAPSCTTTASHTWTVASLGSTLCQTLSHTRTGAAVGSYKAWVLADSGCTIAEASEANNTTSADYGVGLPELAITSFSAAVSGSQVSYTAQVCSSGTEITTPFSVGIYFDRPAAPGCSDAPDASETVASLAAGACAQVTAVQPAAGTGTHKAWAFADNLCQVTEGNEDNNLRAYDFGVGVDQPDLRVTNLTVTTAGPTATYVVTVCNAGVAAAAALELGIFYDRSSAPGCGDPPDWTASLASLAPGDCETRTHTRSNTPTGSFKGWAFVDAGCQVGESDETNNAVGHGYTITAEAIDLAVTAFTVTPAGSGALFLATVCNLGSSRSGATVTAFYQNRAAAPAASCGDPPDLKAKLEPLDPGQCVNQSLARKAGPPGSYQAWVQVDGECALAEADESNNGASVSYTLTPGGPGDAGVDSLGGEGVGGDGCSCQLGAAPGPVGLLGLGLGLAILALRLGRRRIPCGIQSPRSRIGDE